MRPGYEVVWDVLDVVLYAICGGWLGDGRGMCETRVRHDMMHDATCNTMQHAMSSEQRDRNQEPGTERLGDQPGQKAKYWLISKQIMRAAPRFFVCTLACHL
jgi:hypothetical protein